MAASQCQCVKTHTPANPPIEKHHYPPTSYPLKPGGKRLLIPLCSNAHGIQHRLLNLMKNLEPGIFPKGYSQFHRDIATYTWANTDRSKPIPRTLASPTLLPGEDTLSS